jgi:hypothetical protein
LFLLSFFLSFFSLFFCFIVFQEFFELLIRKLKSSSKASLACRDVESVSACQVFPSQFTLLTLFHFPLVYFCNEKKKRKEKGKERERKTPTPLFYFFFSLYILQNCHYYNAVVENKEIHFLSYFGTDDFRSSDEFSKQWTQDIFLYLLFLFFYCSFFPRVFRCIAYILCFDGCFLIFVCFCVFTLDKIRNQGKCNICKSTNATKTAYFRQWPKYLFVLANNCKGKIVQNAAKHKFSIGER